MNKIHWVHRHVLPPELNKALVRLQQRLIVKVFITNAIKKLVMMNLRKQLAAAETLYNKMSLKNRLIKL